jgi:sugar phosphate isomerase/epimerase
MAAMLRAISTHIFRAQRLNASLLDILAAGGAQAVEVFATRQHFDYNNRAHVQEIADWFAASTVQPWSLHAPIFADADNGRGGAPAVNVIHAEKARRIDAMDEVKRALESAEIIPFRHMVLHLGERGDTWSPRALEHSMTAVEHLRAFARPLGVQILLENLEVNEVARPRNLLEILNIGHLDDIGVCLDLGHANLTGGVEDAIGVLGDRIRSCHVHDNQGDRDAHLWPGEGSIAWGPSVTALNAIRPTPPAAVLELGSAGNDAGSKLSERLRQTFDWMDAQAAQAPR